MSTKTYITLELTKKEAQDLLIITGRGIRWITPVIGISSKAIYDTLRDAGVQYPNNPLGHDTYAKFNRDGSIVG